MSPELVILTGDNDSVNDDVFVGDWGEQVTGFLSKVGQAVKGGYGVQTPQGALSISERGLEYTQPGAAAPPTAPTTSARLFKNPLVIGGAILITALLLFKKR